jgi:hypothetical protein
VAVSSTRAAKKNSSDTGAKNDTRETSGPASAGLGIDSAIGRPDTTLSYRHVRSQPLPVRCAEVGDTASVG